MHNRGYSAARHGTDHGYVEDTEQDEIGRPELSGNHCAGMLNLLNVSQDLDSGDEYNK